MIYMRTYLLIWSLLFTTLMWSQTKYQVVTKTIKKTMTYRDGYSLNIEGESAEIIIHTWDKNKIQIVLDLVVKNPDKKKAVKDLQEMQYKIVQHGDKIFLRNITYKNKHADSKLSARYTLTIPEVCPVYLKNNFGVTNVFDLASSFRVNSEFSSLMMANMTGDIDINSFFGDIFGKNIIGRVNVISRRSDVTFRNIAGDFDINAKYGIVKFFTNKKKLTLNIDAKKSDVYFFSPSPEDYGFTLTAHYGNFSVPEDLKFNFKEMPQKIKTAYYNSRKEMGTITIKISFGDISIKHL